MKPLYRKILNKGLESFSVRHDVVPQFTIPWHYHSELELLYIIKGSGTRFVGDSIENYEAGDLVLVGENLPHFWRSDPSVPTPTEAIVVHFLRDFWGKSFSQLPEMRSITHLLDCAQQGLYIKGKTAETIKTLMSRILNASDALRIAHLIEVLDVLALANTDILPLSKDTFPEIYQRLDKRLQAVYDYVMMNFQSVITLEQVASIANMTPSSFCRYFKSTTHKSFIFFLNEVRINNACKQLLSREQSMSYVAIASGFGTTSNFNKQFLKKMGMSPKEYRRKFITI
jgi:AraC-like DNA-binding protein